MPAICQETERPAVQDVPLEAVLSASKTYSFEQVLKLCDGVTINDLRAQFSGAHVTGHELLEWQRTALTKTLRVKANLASRILRAKAVAGNASLATRPTRAAGINPPEPEATAPIALVARPAGQHGDDGPVTLETVIRRDWWYLLGELPTILDGLDAGALRRMPGNRTHILGSELLHFAAIVAREGRPLTVKKSVVDQILANRQAAAAGRREAIGNVQAKGRELLAEIERLQALASTADEKRSVHVELLRKHAAILREIDDARDALAEALSAGNQAEVVEKELRRLAHRHPVVFERREGQLPRVRDLDEIEGVEGGARS